MARPWPKKSVWPYVAKSGRKSYTVGFYDHDKREHSRTFPSVRHARAWMDDYIIAERRGLDSLRRFLLDLDAKEANEAEGRTIAQILELFLEVDAHPRNEEGVAPSTYALYRSVLSCHLLGKPRHPSRQQTQIASGGLRRRDRQNTSQCLQRAARAACVARADARSRCARTDSRTCVACPLIRAELGRAITVCAGDPNQRMQPRQRTRGQPPTVRAHRRHRLHPSRACASAAQLGALTAGRRGDPRPDAPLPRPTQGDPRAPRRNDRKPAIRHGEPQPGALGTSLVLPRRRVRMGDGSPHQRAAPTMGQDRAQHPTPHRPTQHSARRPRAMAGDPQTIRTPCTRERLHHPGRPHQRPSWRARGQDRRLSSHQIAGEALGPRMLHAGGASRRAAPGVRTHPWRHPVRAAPRRHLAAPAHRRPTNCRQRVRHQPKNAQRPLLIPDRGPASTRATTTGRRVARGTRRPHGLACTRGSPTRHRSREHAPSTEAVCLVLGTTANLSGVVDTPTMTARCARSHFAA